MLNFYKDRTSSDGEMLIDIYFLRVQQWLLTPFPFGPLFTYPWQQLGLLLESLKCCNINKPHAVFWGVVKRVYVLQAYLTVLYNVSCNDSQFCIIKTPYSGLLPENRHQLSSPIRKLPYYQREFRVLIYTLYPVKASIKACIVIHGIYLLC